MAGIALIGEAIEFLAGMGGAGWPASLAAMAGGAAGTFLIPAPLFGMLIGACVGAGLAAWGVEQPVSKSRSRSVRTGVGAGVGVFIGTLFKVLVGMVLWLMAAWAAFL